MSELHLMAICKHCGEEFDTTMVRDETSVIDGEFSCTCTKCGKVDAYDTNEMRAVAA